MLNIDTKPSISVLITCHNRKNKTLECLRLLFLQNGLDTDFYIKVFLVDDASTDGTSLAVDKYYPLVKIIHGNGNLFWNRGMHLAWEVARKESNPNFYLWLNDDTFLFEDAILSALKSSRLELDIVCGSTCDDKGILTYGGYTQRNNKLIPNGAIQNCDYCNGNFLLIPAAVVDSIGLNDRRFSHGIGDFDYTVRAKKAGCNLYITPNFIGICSSNDIIPSWRNLDIGLFERIKHLYSPLSGCIPHEYFIYSKRKSGLLKALIHYFTIHLRVIFPNLWKRRTI